MRYKIIGKRGTLITSSPHWKKGDFSNLTGVVIKVIPIKSKTKKIKRKKKTYLQNINRIFR